MPEESRRGTTPLSGVRVLDITTMASGPFATALLAQQGADVIKIEAPSGGDPLRRVGPQRRGFSSLFFNFNRGKRSLALDLAQAEGSALLLRLARSADVFIENMRPGVALRLGLGADRLHVERPDLVYVSINGFGSEGPLAGRRAYDSVIQALSGAAALQADSDSQHPRFINTAIFDKISGLYAAQAISAALYARDRGAGGQHVRLAMLDVALEFLWPDAMQDQTWLDAKGVPEPAIRAGNPPVRRSLDGWLTFSILNDDEFRALCRALDRADLAHDPRFADGDSRARHKGELDALLDGCVATHSSAHLVRRFEAEDVPYALVNSLLDVARDPQVVASGSLVESDEAGFGMTRGPRPATRFGPAATRRANPAPRLGEQSDEILAEFGLDGDEIAGLRERGIVA